MTNQNKCSFCFHCEKRGKEFQDQFICGNNKCFGYLKECSALSADHARIIKFLQANGWSEIEKNDEYINFGKEGNIAVDVGDTDIVLIGDSGDYAEHEINAESLFWLIGRLVAGRNIAMGFVLPEWGRP